MAPPLARSPAAVHITEDGQQQEEEGSLLGSLAPAPAPPAALQCHFKPLTGEVCIAEAPPAADAQGTYRASILPSFAGRGGVCAAHGSGAPVDLP